MTIRELLQKFTMAFTAISDSPSVDARILVEHALKMDGTSLLLAMDSNVPAEKADLLDQYLKRRSEGEPVAYIIGERGFFECVFKVSKDTLIPRADTETLVESAISDAKALFPNHRRISVLDLCCGTGCIGISVAKVLARTFPEVELTLSDLSDKALEICRQNVQNLIEEHNIKADLVCGNLLETVEGRSFDMILSNPPYIRTDVIPGLEKQVQFEPKLALDGGEDGLDLVRQIAAKAPGHLTEGGLLQFEIGYDQGPLTKDILEQNGFIQTEILKDLGGCDRVVKGRIS